MRDMAALDDLPQSLRDRILRLGLPNPEGLATVPFPVLGNRTIAQAATEGRNEDAILSLLDRVERYLGRARADQSSDSC
jgi:hypothetical protein